MDPVGFAWLDAVPPGLLQLGAPELLDRLGGPTVIAVAGPDGTMARPLVVAALLHGNETTGWEAVRGWLARVEAKPPFPVVVVLGNLAAAARNRRNLAALEDHNRCWTPRPRTALERACAKLLKKIAKLEPFLALDIHNTNGSNPCHAVYVRRDDDQRARDFAAMFAADVVCTELVQHTFMEACAALCPALTLECATPADPDGLARADRFLRRLAAAAPRPSRRARFYRIAERIELAAGVRLGHVAGEGEVVIAPDADRSFNFVELRPGTVLATLAGRASDLLRVIDVSGATQRAGAASGYLAQQGDKLIVARACTPALIVCDAGLVAQDCLCYLLVADKLARRDPAGEELVQMGGV